MSTSDVQARHQKHVLTPWIAQAGVSAPVVVRAYQEEALFDRAAEMEGGLRAGLDAIANKHESVGDVRGVGAFFALELVKSRATKEPLVPWHGDGPGVMKTLYAELRKRGVYTFGKFNVCMVAPPLNTEKGELDEGLAALDASLSALEASLG